MKLLLSIISIALTISAVGAVPAVTAPTDILPNTGGDAGITIASVISFFISVSAILAVMSITWGAFVMIYATGEDEKIKKGRMIVIYSFVGLLMSGAAYGIVRLITNLQF